MSVRVGPKWVEVDQVLRDLNIPTHGEVGEEVYISCPWPDNHVHGSVNVNGSVNTRTGWWLCYKGCGSGSLERLVELVLAIDVKRARTWLLARAGVPAEFNTIQALLDELTAPPPEPEVDATKAFQLDYSRMVTTRTSSFILERGFTPQTLREWGFRYDPAMRAIVIPVYDIGGSKLVGVIRRLVPPIRSGFPKYLYPEGFKKQRHLFGAYRHRSDRGEVILVEGPLDAVWLHQHGYTGAVALLGATCSQVQQKLLAQLGQTVILALDNDSTGLKAMDRLVGQLGRDFHVMYTSVVGGKKDVQELDAVELADVFGTARQGWEVPA